MAKRYGRRARKSYGRRGRRMRRTTRRSRKATTVKKLARKVRKLETMTVQSKICTFDLDQTIGALTGVSVYTKNMIDLSGSGSGNYTLRFPIGASKEYDVTGMTGTNDCTLQLDKIAIKLWLDTNEEWSANVNTVAALVSRRNRKKANTAYPAASDIIFGRDGRLYMDPNEWKIHKQQSLVNIQYTSYSTVPDGAFSYTVNPRKCFNYTMNLRGKLVDYNPSTLVPKNSYDDVFLIIVTNNLTGDTRSPRIYGTGYFRYRDGLL